MMLPARRTSNNRCLLLLWLVVFHIAVIVLVCRGKAMRAYCTKQDDDNDDDKEPSPVLPQPYPDSFSISFVTNIARNENDDSIEATDDSNNDNPLPGTLYYDWTSHSQRIDHAAGSYECQRFYHWPRACSLIFRSDGEGLYRLLLYPNQDDDDIVPDCCLDLTGLGPPRPNWAAEAHPTYTGVVQDAWSGLPSHEWIFDRLDPPLLDGSLDENSSFLRSPASKYHSLRQAVGATSFAPLVFGFPGKAGGRQDFHYQLDSLQIGPQHAQLFEIPKGCEKRLCSATAHEH